MKLGEKIGITKKFFGIIISVAVDVIDNGIGLMDRPVAHLQLCFQTIKHEVVNNNVIFSSLFTIDNILISCQQKTMLVRKSS